MNLSARLNQIEMVQRYDLESEKCCFSLLLQLALQHKNYHYWVPMYQRVAQGVPVVYTFNGLHTVARFSL